VGGVVTVHDIWTLRIASKKIRHGGNSWFVYRNGFARSPGHRLSHLPKDERAINVRVGGYFSVDLVNEHWHCHRLAAGLVRARCAAFAPYHPRLFAIPRADRHIFPRRVCLPRTIHAQSSHYLRIDLDRPRDLYWRSRYAMAQTIGPGDGNADHGVGAIDLRTESPRFVLLEASAILHCCFPMMRKDDFDYAIENTQVILAPEQQIATFGTTSFHFYLISELMDRVDQVRIRNGKIHAERPQILTPEHFSRLLLEGFGEKAQRYADQLREYARNIAVLRYGFQFRKTNVMEETIRDSVDAVITRTKRRVEDAEEPLSAVIQGVDDAWEVCLLKFTIDMIERSAGENLGDFRKRGLI